MRDFSVLSPHRSALRDDGTPCASGQETVGCVTDFGTCDVRNNDADTDSNAAHDGFFAVGLTLVVLPGFVMAHDGRAVYVRRAGRALVAFSVILLAVYTMHPA